MPITASAQTTTTGAALWSEYLTDTDNHSHIPNVPYAGYRRGEVSVPEVPVVVNVLDFGAVNDGTGDNTRAFREAIDAAWYAGGGAVLIPAGTYRVEQIILLHRNGVVLRGEGPGETIIQFANPLFDALGSTGYGSQHWNWAGGLVWVGPRDLFQVQDSGRWTQLREDAPGFDVNAGNWEAWRNQGVITEVTSTHPRGVRSVTVADASTFSPGDFVLMTWTNTADDALWKEITQHQSFSNFDFGDWLEATPYFGWPVEIESIAGNTISFVRPTRVSIAPEYNVSIRHIGQSVREAGVESMTLSMENTREIYSYNNGVGWNGLVFNRAFNSWARNIEIINAETPLNVSSSVNVSVLDVQTTGGMQAKYIFTNRVMSHDVLYDDFRVLNTGVLTNGINTEWLGTGNVWTRGQMDKGTFDSHRLMPFDYLRTDITMRNPTGARPGGDGKAGPFTGRRAVHWNVRIQDSDRAADRTGQWVYHPIQYTYGAQIGITGAIPYTFDSPWAMPGGDKAMLIGDAGVEPSPANLFDAQKQHRRDTQSWVRLTWPTEGFLSHSEPIFRAEGNASGGEDIASIRFHVNDDLIGTANVAPYAYEWIDAVPGRYNVRVELIDTAGGSTWSRPYDVVIGERKRLEHNDPTIQYGGSWTVNSHPEYSAGQARLTSSTGNQHFEVVFRGTRVRWITRQNNNGQVVTIRLNGFEVAQKTVHGGQTYYRHIGWDSGELPEGIYTLRIETSTRLVLDHLEITSTAGATGEPTAPDAPGNLAAIAVSSSEIDLLWTRGSSNEQGFRVERRIQGESDWTLIATVAAAFTNYADSGLAHGVTYEYQVMAYNVFGESEFSAITSATTPEPVMAPAAPSALLAQAVAHNRVDLAWTNNANDQLGFEVERLGPIGSWEKVATLPLSAVTWIDIGLAPETNYQYRIRAFNSAGASAFSNIVSVTTPVLSETAGNLFPESWFLQSLDNTGEILVNDPAKVTFTGVTTNQHRGVVARINEETILGETGDFIEISFTTEGMSTANNLQYVFRFGLYHDAGQPVASDFSTVTDNSVGFFTALGNRYSSGRRSNLLRQGSGTGPILARGNGSNGLPVNGVANIAETQTANFGNRDAVFRIERLEGGVLRTTLDMLDGDGRSLFLTAETTAANVPTYSFNQIAFLFVINSGNPTIDELVIRRGGPSFEEAPPAGSFANWRAQQFNEAELTDPSISGPLADPSNQGITNLKRHAFGLDRNESAASAIPAVEYVEDSGLFYFLITHLLKQDATDVSVSVQASVDLSDWNGFEGSIEPYGEPVLTERPGVVRLTHRVIPPMGASKTFIRVAVEAME